MHSPFLDLTGNSPKGEEVRSSRQEELTLLRVHKTLLEIWQLQFLFGVELELIKDIVFFDSISN